MSCCTYWFGRFLSALPPLSNTLIYPLLSWVLPASQWSAPKSQGTRMALSGSGPSGGCRSWKAWQNPPCSSSSQCSCSTRQIPASLAGRGCWTSCSVPCCSCRAAAGWRHLPAAAAACRARTACTAAGRDSCTAGYRPWVQGRPAGAAPGSRISRPAIHPASPISASSPSCMAPKPTETNWCRTKHSLGVCCGTSRSRWACGLCWTNCWH